MIYSAHQPNLLPYTGFFYKMAKADVFDLKIWEQYVTNNYQRRVMMRDQWVTLPLVKGSSRDPINVKRVMPQAPGHLADEIVKRYTHANKKPTFWDARAPRICDEVLSITTDLLWEFNFRLIMLMRDVLGISTPITFTQPGAEGATGSASVISAMQAFNCPLSYLSGQGGRKYMGDLHEFNEAGIPVIWSQHHANSTDSILSVIFDHEDPMTVVLAENDRSNNLDLGGIVCTR